MVDPFHIFICYAREDRDSLESLRRKLAPLKQSGRAHIWYDGEIIGGKDWDHEIRRNLKSADLVLLLISDDFFDSDYISRVELREALEANARLENIVVPVILHDCIWTVHRELAKLQALPAEAKPIYVEEHWKKPELGFANVAHGVVKILDDADTETRRVRKTDRLEAVRKAAAAEQRRLEKEQAAAEAVRQKRAAEQQRKESEAAKQKGLPDMVFVKGGSFQMGDAPGHPVTLSDFEIGKYPVTIREYLVFCNETNKNHPQWLETGSKYHLKTGSDNYYKREGIGREFERHPIVGISWHDAAAYCNWLSEKHGKRYRLPTEAEWEYAARGGAHSKGFLYAGSNDLNEVGWFSENAGSKSHPVGQKKANELGLYDMSGNVWEWCSDWYADYPSGTQTNPTGPATGSVRMLRGGSAGSVAVGGRVAFRLYASPDYCYDSYGFRLCRTF